MSEVHPKPEQNPATAEGELEREGALNDLFGLVYCGGRTKRPYESYDQAAINATAARYFDASHIKTHPSSVTRWGKQENEAAEVLATVVTQAMFNTESVLSASEKLRTFYRSHDALLYKIDLMENKHVSEDFVEQVERQASVMLNAHSEDPSISEAEYKMLFGLYKSVYIKKTIMTADTLPYPVLTPAMQRLSFWAHIAEGGLMRLLVPQRMHIEPPLPPIGDLLSSTAADERREYQRWMDTMHPKAKDDLDEPDDGATKI